MQPCYTSCMSKSSATFIDMDELRNSVDIVSVIGEHVQLRKAGSIWKGLCPFHQEKTPSFTVCERRRTYRCFGCGAHGDVVKFLQELHQISFVDAIKLLGWNKENKKRVQLLFRNEPCEEQVLLEDLWDRLVREPTTTNVRQFWVAINSTKQASRLRGRMAVIARSGPIFCRTLLGMYASKDTMQKVFDIDDGVYVDG